MNKKPGLAPVRQRIRTSRTETGVSPEQRLVADADDQLRKKRKPNRGSFKKGEPSRNPKGRPKGAKGARASARRVLGEKVKLRTPQGLRKVTFYETLLIKERELAIQGDWRARKTMLEIGRWSMPEELVEDLGMDPAEPSEADRAVLEWFEAELREKNRQRAGNQKKDEGDEDDEYEEDDPE